MATGIKEIIDNREQSIYFDIEPEITTGRYVLKWHDVRGVPQSMALTLQSLLQLQLTLNNWHRKW